MRQLSRRRYIGSGSVPTPVIVGSSLVAILIGVLASFEPAFAVGALVTATFGVVALLRPAIVLVALTATIYLESIAFAGVTVGRLVAPLALLIVLAEVARGRARVLPLRPGGWVVAYVLWVFASALWTSDLGRSSEKYWALAIALVYVLAFSTLIREPRDLDRVLATIAVGSLLVGLIAIGTLLTGDVTRAVGGVGDANFFAASQIISLPPVLLLAGRVTKRWQRLGLYATAAVVIGSVLGSLSRGGFIALLGILLVAMFVPSRALFRTRAQKIALVLIVLAGVGFVGGQSSSQLAPRLESIFQPGQDRTGSGRLNQWLGAWTSIQERPLLGLGYGGFGPASNDLMRRTPGVDFSDFELRPRGSEAHSVYISTLAELGVPGLLLFLGLLGSTVRTYRRTARNALAAGDSAVARAANSLLLSLAGWAIASVFLSSEASRPLWILIGLALALPALTGAPIDRVRRWRS